MLSLCVVCAGNICRSPMAEAVVRRALDDAGLADRVSVVSAGMGRWHVGQPADDRALAILAERGYDATDHRARVFDASWFDRFDLVLALDRDNLADLHRLGDGRDDLDRIQMLRAYDADALERGELDVPDPYYGGVAEFAHALDLIERAATGLVETIASEVNAEVDAEVGAEAAGEPNDEPGGEPRRR